MLMATVTPDVSLRTAEDDEDRMELVAKASQVLLDRAVRNVPEASCWSGLSIALTVILLWAPFFSPFHPPPSQIHRMEVWSRCDLKGQRPPRPRLTVYQWSRQFSGRRLCSSLDYK